jgi:hypothetical protein
VAAEAIQPDLSRPAFLRRSEGSVATVEAPRTESAPAVNALEHEILTRVAELRRLRPDSMSMLLRPDPQTEVHLHLQLQDGVVEIEAKLQRGVWGLLSPQWEQLQQNLSGQGVRLSALSETSTPDFSGRNGAGSFPQQSARRQQQEESQRPEWPWRPADPAVSPVVAQEKGNGPPSRASEWWA